MDATRTYHVPSQWIKQAEETCNSTSMVLGQADSVAKKMNYPSIFSANVQKAIKSTNGIKALRRYYGGNEAVRYTVKQRTVTIDH